MLDTLNPKLGFGKGSLSAIISETLFDELDRQARSATPAQQHACPLADSGCLLRASVTVCFDVNHKPSALHPGC